MALCPVCRNALPDTAPDHCPNCGANVAAEAAEAAPAGGPPPAPPLATVPPPVEPPPAAATGSGRSRTPWDERDRTGILTALVETTREVLTAPTRFFRAMPVTGGIGSPLLYAVIVGWLGLVATALYGAIYRSIVGTPLAAFGDRPEVAAMLGWAASWGGFVVQAVFGGISVVIGVFLSSAVLHLMLLLLGGARGDFEATLRVVCFSQATSVLALLPFCGQIAAFFWTIALYAIGLSQAHEIGTGKALAAVLLPLVLLCCCCGGTIALFAGALASLLPGVVGS